LSSAGDGVGIQVEEVGQLTITATAQLERLQAGVEAALLLVQQAVEQEEGSFQFLLRDLQQGRIHHGGDALHGAARHELPSLDDGVDGRVEVQPGDDLAGNSALLSQLMQRVLHFDVQGPSQFRGEIPAGGTINDSFGGGQQRAETGEPYGCLGPQSVVVETGDFSQGVVSAAMRVAGEIIGSYPKSVIAVEGLSIQEVAELSTTIRRLFRDGSSDQREDKSKVVLKAWSGNRTVRDSRSPKPKTIAVKFLFRQGVGKSAVPHPDTGSV
jgi:hypothetical protein